MKQQRWNQPILACISLYFDTAFYMALPDNVYIECGWELVLAPLLPIETVDIPSSLTPNHRMFCTSSWCLKHSESAFNSSRQKPSLRRNLSFLGIMHGSNWDSMGYHGIFR